MVSDPPSPADLPPILVLAAPGVPGQTLAAALGRNPAAYDLPETLLELEPVLDGLLREMTGLRGGQIHGLLRALGQLLAGEQSIAAVEMARRWLMRRRHLPTLHVARQLAALVAPRRLVRPVTAALFDPAAAERLQAAYPGAALVHLTMDPAAQATAVMAQAGGAAALLAGAVDRSDGTARPDPQTLRRLAEEGAARIGAAHRLALEALLAAPEAALGNLARALGLPAGAGAVAAMLRPEASPFTGPGPFGAHLGGDIRSLAALGTPAALTLAPA